MTSKKEQEKKEKEKDRQAEQERLRFCQQQYKSYIQFLKQVGYWTSSRNNAN